MSVKTAAAGFVWALERKAADEYCQFAWLKVRTRINFGLQLNLCYQAVSEVYFWYDGCSQGGVTSLWEAAKHQDFKAQQKLLQQTDESVCWDDIKLLFVENMTEMNRHAADTSSITETDRGKKHEKICQVCSCATLVEIWMAEFLWKEIFLLQFRGVF